MVARDRFRISGKDLGALSMPSFCPHCFWIQRSAPSGLPFQIFPGIFSSIDAFTKRVVHGWFDRHRRAPDWLAALPGIVGYREPPHHSKFWIDDPESGMKLTGAPDALFVKADESLVVGDYKTAKYTEGQEELLPVYETQLNAYALVAQRRAMGSVSGLALIYAEPVTTELAAASDEAHTSGGFRMEFSVRVLNVVPRLEEVSGLLSRARRILELERAPAGRDGCRDCERLEGLLRVAGH